MGYSVTVTPDVIRKGESATVEVTLVDADPQDFLVALRRVSDGEHVGEGQVTLAFPKSTVSANEGANTDYHLVVDGPFKLTQTSARTFELTVEE